MKVGLFNGVVLTTNGLYRVSDISSEEARCLVRERGYVSAIGHEATAEILSQILAVDVSMNRIQFHQQIGQKVIVLKLNQRPAEGEVLDKEQVEAIGYQLKLLERME